MEKNKFVCRVAVSPVRAEAKDPAEMVSQLLFGEIGDILERDRQWLKVKNAFDGYEGWIDSKQITELSDEEYEKLSSSAVQYTSEEFSFFEEEGQKFYLPIGCPIREEKLPTRAPKGEKADIVSLAFKYINTPYLWGGRSTFGIDCSGFSQQVYKMVGINLPRDAYQQADQGEVLGFIEEAEVGDLAFFDNENGKIVHVGIVLEEGKIIHAHGKVRVDTLDNSGIYNAELNKYTHRLRFVKKLF